VAKPNYSVLKKYKASLNKPEPKGEDTAGELPPPPPPPPPPPDNPIVGSGTEMPADPQPADPQTAVTKKGRMDVAAKALEQASPSFKDPAIQALSAFNMVRKAAGLDEVKDTPANRQLATRSIDDYRDEYDPQLDKAQTRRELVQRLQENVYGARGLLLPDEYNIPFEERGALGQFGMAKADLQEMRPESLDNTIDRNYRETVRKKKVDPAGGKTGIEGESLMSLPSRISEAASYPTRLGMEGLARLLGYDYPISEPYSSVGSLSIPDLGKDRIRPEMLGGDDMYGLRSIEAIKAQGQSILDKIQEIQSKPAPLLAGGGDPRPLETQRAEAEERKVNALNKLKNQFEAIIEERDEIQKYIDSMRQNAQEQ
tara:strand:+ start:2360 stop:3469 length:1110 start_codon:yes stop_codon:yes gene_type:complete